MDILKRLIYKRTPLFYPYKKTYPSCGREFCYCIKTTNLDKKKNLEMYFECYRRWYMDINQ